MKKRVTSTFLVLTLLSIVGVPVAHAHHPEGTTDRWNYLIKTRSWGGVVASESLQASQAGLEVLEGGGNAVDAAIATTFAIGVTRPEMCGIGAGGFLVYRGADGSTTALDFRETAPAAMTENTFNMASEGGSTSKMRPGIHNELSGHMAIGVPGVVAGMDEALKVLGSGVFTLDKLIAPAERYAREGIEVSPILQLWLALGQAEFANYPETARIYGGRFAHGGIVNNAVLREAGKAGVPLPPEAIEALRGDQTAPGRPGEAAAFKQEDYAKSLSLIMEHGPEAFYEVHDYPSEDPLGRPTPSIGKLIVEDMETAEEEAKLNPVLMAKTNGQPNDIGLIVENDLANYEPIWRTPLIGQYRDHKVITMPPPAGGAVALEILNLLENFKLSTFGHSSADHIHALAEAQKLAWADRLKYYADPGFTYDYDGDGSTEPVPTAVLTSKRYAQQRGSEIDMSGGPNTAKSIDEYGGGSLTPPHEGSHTTHLSVIDREGNAVAVTCSLESPFGSSVVAPGTGFLLNNQLTDFTKCWQPEGGAPPSDPNDPCRSVGMPPNAPAGGKRPLSAQTPTIVVKDEQPVLVIGAAGGPMIILGVVQQIVNVVDFGMDIFHAMDAPRVDTQPFKDCPKDAAPEDRRQLAVEASDNDSHGRVSSDVQKLLINRGHSICRVGVGAQGYYNAMIMNSAGTDLVTGERLATSDPRQTNGFCDDQGAIGEGTERVCQP